MDLPAPRVKPLRPPSMPLWAPRTRSLLYRFFARMDRRKARRLAQANLSYMDAAWLRTYTVWWENEGWMTGAAHPRDAWQQMVDHRRRTRKPSNT